jgi:hypothetical protein
VQASVVPSVKAKSDILINSISFMTEKKERRLNASSKREID